MTLSTATLAGVVSSRTVLLKRNDSDKLVFESEDFSRKGRELAANPQAAVTLYWKEVHRQVTVTGQARPLSDEESDEMWRQRGRANQAATVATHEGDVISSLEEELELHKKAEAIFSAAAPIARPSSYRAYGLYPVTIEFWEGSEARLHRRLFYEQQGSHSWAWRRLQP